MERSMQNTYEASGKRLGPSKRKRTVLFNMGNTYDDIGGTKAFFLFP